MILSAVCSKNNYFSSGKDTQRRNFLYKFFVKATRFELFEHGISLYEYLNMSFFKGFPRKSEIRKDSPLGTGKSCYLQKSTKVVTSFLDPRFQRAGSYKIGAVIVNV